MSHVSKPPYRSIRSANAKTPELERPLYYLQESGPFSDDAERWPLLFRMADWGVDHSEWRVGMCAVCGLIDVSGRSRSVCGVGFAVRCCRIEYPVSCVHEYKDETCVDEMYVPSTQYSMDSSSQVQPTVHVGGRSSAPCLRMCSGFLSLSPGRGCHWVTCSVGSSATSDNFHT